MSSRPDSATSAAPPSSTSGPIQVTDDRPYWPSEPLPQANRPVVSVRNSSSSVTVTASRAIAIAEPASTSRVGPEPAAGGQRQHQRRGGQAAEERQAACERHRQRPAQRDGQHQQQVRAGVDAEQVR